MLTSLARLVVVLGLCAFMAPTIAAAQTAQLPAPQPPVSELVKARIAAERASVTPGQPMWVGVHLRMKEHWHTYWRNPGDSGVPTEIKWQLPPGFTAGPILWPTPQRLPVDHLVNFGFENEALLMTELQVPGNLEASAPVEIKADVTWLVCEKICIPGEAKLTLSLPVTNKPILDPNESDLFADARQALPVASHWPAKLTGNDGDLTLEIDAPQLGGGSITEAFFFPYADALIDHAAPQELKTTPAGLTLRLKKNTFQSGPLPAAAGVLALTETIDGVPIRQSLAIGSEPPAPISTAATSPPSQVAPPPASKTEFSLALLAQSVLFAFLGGIILNLMPCVFPVLAVKVLNLVQHSGEPPERVRTHGLAYTAGVLASFAVLAIALLAARAAGDQIGWGFQLQSPVIVLALAYVLFAMGLSLSGLYDIGGSIVGLGGSLAERRGYAGAFFAGTLATIVATPCTAPFMGAALGFALVQPAAVALAVFLALGLGLALPFLILTWVPALASRLPRPGAWMETLKQALAFPMYLTVVWLVWVLSQQVGPDHLFLALAGFVVLALALWTFELAKTSDGMPRLAAQVVSLIALIATTGVLTAMTSGPGAAPSQQLAAKTLAPGEAQPFTAARLDALRAEGRPVFVNMTAAWCVTCLVNERTTLSTTAVKSAFAARGVIYLKGDWTNRNPEITRVLEEHGRAGVPLYLLFDGRSPPIVLPQILTERIVLDSLDLLGQPANNVTKADLHLNSKE